MTAVEALSLFDVAPLVEPDPARRATIEERFLAFHDANPWVYRALVKLARDERRARPGERVGIGMLTEVVRWHYNRSTTGRPWKVNNDYRSRYVRLIQANEPDLADAFETRKLRAR